MEDLKDKFILFKNLPYLQANKYYVNVLVNVVIGYLLQKNFNIYMPRNNKQADGIIFFNNVVISLRYSLVNVKIYNYEMFEYYLKVFLGQEVATNLEWDFEMMKQLGELYPRQHEMLADFYFDENLIKFSVCDEYLKGIDFFSKQYINNWNMRTEKLFQWLDAVTVDLSTLPLEWQKLYEASVRSINEQPLAPYYLTFFGHLWLKLTKDQYFKILCFYLYNYFAAKKVDFYIDMLNLKIIALKIIIGETQNENFSAAFPQIFIPLFLEEWNIVNDFEPDLSLDIRRVYVSKLWVKYYGCFKQQFWFFKKFPELKKLESAESAMLIYLKSLSDDEFFWHFLIKFLEYLDRCEKK